MAISLGFGILFTTVIILLLVPCLYLGLEDLLRVTRRERGAQEPRDGHEAARARLREA
jgi:hypothetical protein